MSTIVRTEYVRDGVLLIDLAYSYHDVHEMTDIATIIARVDPGKDFFVSARPGSRWILVESDTVLRACRVGSLPWCATIAVTWSVASKIVINACRAAHRLGGPTAVDAYLCEALASCTS